MRQLTQIEAQRLAALTSQSVEVTLIEPTATGLVKSIMDATASVRKYLSDHKVHDYDTQRQGPDHKIILPAHFLSENLIISSRASLYRPLTKKGDPRIWFTGLKAFCGANDILALFAFEGVLWVVNLTDTNLLQVMEERSGPIWDLVSQINQDANQVAQELLGKLHNIARRGYVPSVIEGRADTAIGRTLETLLGIGINSSKEPDYKGIELKSFRRQAGSRENRKTLFAQVPHWESSRFKSSREILDHFGYQSGCDFKLYCTISTLRKNSQGLRFTLDIDSQMLVEVSDKANIGDFAVWRLDDLHRRLLEKHNETFWISADSRQENGREYFQFTQVRHTRKPIVSQFDILLEQGIITMDHLIKRNTQGRVSEKGPLFKINAASLGMLFPPSVLYDLSTSHA